MQQGELPTGGGGLGGGGLGTGGGGLTTGGLQGLNKQLIMEEHPLYTFSLQPWHETFAGTCCAVLRMISVIEKLSREPV